jgi:hypothetical protein
MASKQRSANSDGPKVKLMHHNHTREPQRTTLKSRIINLLWCALSIKTSRMLQSIWIVVPRTSTEKRTRQIKSSICHLGLYQIMALAIMTPTLCIRSPNTFRYVPCTMLLSWCCFCCLHLLLLPDKSQVIIHCLPSARTMPNHGCHGLQHHHHHHHHHLLI